MYLKKVHIANNFYILLGVKLTSGVIERFTIFCAS